jgi:hypothetical protein
MGDVDYFIPRPKSLVGNGSILILAAEPMTCKVQSNGLTMPFGNLSSASEAHKRWSLIWFDYASST